MAPKPTCSAYKCRFHLGIGLGTLLRKKLENSAEFEEDFEDFAARRLGIDTPPPLHEQHQAAARTLLTEFGFRADRFA